MVSVVVMELLPVAVTSPVAVVSAVPVVPVTITIPVSVAVPVAVLKQFLGQQLQQEELAPFEVSGLDDGRVLRVAISCRSCFSVVGAGLQLA